MLVSAPQLGFSITSPFKTIARVGTRAAKGAYSVARDPRVQMAVAAVAQRYAPGQYAQVTQQAQQFLQQGRQIQQALRPPPGTPPPPQAIPADDDTMPDSPPVKASHGLFTVAAIAGAGLVLVLLLKK